MFITFRKWTVLYVLSLILLVVSFALIMQSGESVQTIASVGNAENSLILIIDPGHGGEDGGAVASDGTIESQINLSIACTTADLAALLGWKTCMTRNQDISIHDSTAKTLREKKVSDLKNRVAICNEFQNGVLISIHQNSLPSSKNVRGAQVFYNSKSGSAELAGVIQAALNQVINQGNSKESKTIGDSSYLMKNVKLPAVLIECGFLSNNNETQLLKSQEYHKKLAVCIIGSITPHLRNSGK